MAIETIDDIVDELADLLGIYDAHDDYKEDDSEPCRCRCCFETELKGRIREAIFVELSLDAGRRAKAALLEAEK